MPFVAKVKNKKKRQIIRCLEAYDKEIKIAWHIQISDIFIIIVSDSQINYDVGESCFPECRRPDFSFIQTSIEKER